jgi:hypothetical protein
MTCTKCDNTMSLCTCDDAEARIADLEKSPYLSMDWAGLRAARAANASKIARLKEDATKPFHPVAEFQRLTGFSLSPEAEAARPRALRRIGAGRKWGRGPAVLFPQPRRLQQPLSAA